MFALVHNNFGQRSAKYIKVTDFGDLSKEKGEKLAKKLATIDVIMKPKERATWRETKGHELGRCLEVLDRL